MLRNGLRRCAALRSPAFATGLSIPLRGRIVQNLAPANALRPFVVAPTQLSSRFMSSEAVAPRPSEDATPPESQTISRFEDLAKLGVHNKLIKSIVEGMGYETMTEVQSKSINAGLNGKDMVAQAKTGTGKTLAFLIPILQRMIQEDPRLANKGEQRFARSDDIRGLILSPTRELAEQIAVEARKLARGTGLVVQLAVGGTQKREMLQRTRREGCHLLVGTPGRVCDLLSDPQSRIAAPNLAAYVLDEADRMLDVGFAGELENINEHLPNPKVRPRQTMMFSATIPREVINLARNMVRQDQFQFVQTIDPNDVLTHERIPQHIVRVQGMTSMFPALWEIIDRGIEESKQPGGRPFKAMVFFATTSMTELAGQLARDLHRSSSNGRPPSFTIHGKLTQAQRSQMSSRFRNAQSAILLTSDVTARGMDFPDVTHVIQVAPPENSDQYIHRLGRTGRQGKDGQGWLLVTNAQAGSVRELMQDLPLKKNDSLACAKHDVRGGSEDAPPHFEELKAAYQRVPRETLSDAYLAFFGKLGVRGQQMLDELNDWTKHGWGWDMPPEISQRTVEKRGLTRLRGINIGGGGRSRSNDDFGDDNFASTFSREWSEKRPSGGPFSERPQSGGYGNRRPSDRFSSRGGYGKRSSSDRSSGGRRSRDDDMDLF